MEPLLGLFDARSPADALPFGVWRYLQNMVMVERNKLSRAPGWDRLLSQVGYNNQDLHDQLVSISPGSQRQPVTFLFQATSTVGYSKLLAGTSRRLFALNNETGNWKVLSDLLTDGIGTGCSDHGWEAGQVDNIVVLTNGVHDPVYYVLDQPPIETGQQSVTTIPDLDKIGLSRAQVVVAYKGLILLMNVVMDGERISHRVVWSDASRPLSWVPRAGESVAGFQDLGYGHDILGAAEMGDSVIIYTTSGIWEAFLSGGEPALGFRRRYTDNTAGNRCLTYRRTLVSMGDEHIYMGRDGIYRYNFYTPRPIREEWMHAASSVIYDNLSEDCDVHCGGYDAQNKTVWLSWAQQGEACPNRTLILNTEYNGSSVIDHGFTAFVNYNPDNPLTIRQWLLDLCICTREGMDSLGQGFVKEGQYCVAPTETECVPLTNLWTSARRTVDDLTVEDWDAATEPGTLCAALDGVTMDQLCSDELTADECRAEQLFVAASSADFAIKQIGLIYARERVTNSDPCGEYVLDGYSSILRSGPIDLKNPALDKLVRHLAVDLVADEQPTPNNLHLRVGGSFTPADPNTDKCALRWFTQPSRVLACPPTDGEEHKAANTRQGIGTEWPLYIQDRYLVVELSIHGTGGATAFSKLVFWIDQKGKK